MSTRVGSTPRRELTLLDFTLLVIGAVIGAGVYVVAALRLIQRNPCVAWRIASVEAGSRVEELHLAAWLLHSVRRWAYQ